MSYSIHDYEYALPPASIARHPAAERENSRLLCFERDSGGIRHRCFRDLPDRLQPGDVLVVNNTRVIPARLQGKKSTGGKIEVFLLDYVGGMNRYRKTGVFVAECLLKSAKPAKPGTLIHFADPVTAEVISHKGGAVYEIAFSTGLDIDRFIDAAGMTPLPPYINRDLPIPADVENYQTVYARHRGAVAAPTAGLHFSAELIDRIQAMGVRMVEITLHVGYGTFAPVRETDIRLHRIHHERFCLTRAAAETINHARMSGGRVVAVGTTCVRTLEFSADEAGVIHPGEGSCDLFIYPGYRFTAVDVMITNFHLPGSTLLMLVSAFAGRERVLSLYRQAVEAGYRFYSYGDAMLIE